MTDYQKQATNFLTKTETTFEAKFLKNDLHFAGDKEKRDIYEITLQRGDRKMIFNFGQSINNSSNWLERKSKDSGKVGCYHLENFGFNEKQSDEFILATLRQKQIQLHGVPIFKDTIKRRLAPTPYDILAGLTKYDVGTLENFCDDFGYDSDSKTVEKIYLAVQKEFADVQKLWTDKEIEELQEIN